MSERPNTNQPTANDDSSLLEVENLHTHFDTDDGTVRAVDGVSFSISRGETVAIVGESGSGKTVTGESITRLFKSPPGYISAGSVTLDGRDLTELSDSALRDIRGGRVSHVFQNPQGALNPVYTIGWQLVEALTLHQDVTTEEAQRQAIDLLTQVGIPNASTRFDEYPHELSGGQKQRVIVAIALACEPDLLIADEPTTALDVTIQAQILQLFADLQQNREMAVLFITHDLGVVAEIADRVVVMYAGKIMEQGPVEAIFETPAHPYTRALLNCLPGRGTPGGIPGSLPDPTAPPDGCRFAARCSYAHEECTTGKKPPMYPVDDVSHTVSCIHFSPDADPATVLDDTQPDVSAKYTDGTDTRHGAGDTDSPGRESKPDTDSHASSFDMNTPDPETDENSESQIDGDSQ